MPILTPERTLMYLRKSPVILKATLGDVSQERAQQATDGPDGWSVVEIMCHLRDYEEIFIERARLILDRDSPTLPPYNQEELAGERNYKSQNLKEAFASYLNRRQQFIGILSNLSEAQWQRRGLHPAWGDINMLEVGTNAALHDLNHTEQLVRTLGLADELV
jgi:hypothetical protein